MVAYNKAKGEYCVTQVPDASDRYFYFNDKEIEYEKEDQVKKIQTKDEFFTDERLKNKEYLVYHDPYSNNIDVESSKKYQKNFTNFDVQWLNDSVLKRNEDQEDYEEYFVFTIDKSKSIIS